MSKKTPTPVYSFRTGAHVKGVEPPVAGCELERIRRVNAGKLRSKTVVDEARPEQAPLHPAFEWDDAAAAEAHRCQQARELIRAVRVKYPDSAQPEPAFVHIKAQPAGDSYYQNTRICVGNPDELVIAIQAAERHLNASQRALDDIKAIVEKNGDHDNNALLLLVSESLATARDALGRLRAH